MNTIVQPDEILVHPHAWKLKVQGVVLTYDQPHVRVGDAMAQAGFDPSKPWHIHLIQLGIKRPVDVNFIVDLRTPGIEKIRLMPKDVGNGDAIVVPRREFKLLAKDEDFLNHAQLQWETTICSGRRWLLCRDYPMSQGLTPDKTTLAIEISAEYPVAGLDMFYVYPWVRRSDGADIPNLTLRATIDGLEYQCWSRHRSSAIPWDSHVDNVQTHLALVDGCLDREIA